MQVVIEINDMLYNRIKYLEAHANTMLDELVRGVQNGIPLPENHGDLKDADALKADAQTMTEWNGDVFRCVTERTIDLADTIIPAMKGEDNENN